MPDNGEQPLGQCLDRSASVRARAIRKAFASLDRSPLSLAAHGRTSFPPLDVCDVLQPALLAPIHYRD
jgi:hypothetical protein